MTLGRVKRDIRGLYSLHDRVKLLEDAATLTEAQIGAIAKTYADRAFRRLLIWTVAAACVGSAVVVILGRTL